MNITINRCSRVLMSIAILCMYGMSISVHAFGKKPAPHYDCTAEAAWFTAPSMPTEVKKSADGSSNFCDFYQFSWQAFAFLMSPTKADSAIRSFEDANQFPELEVNSNGSPTNSCDQTSSGNKLFIRVTKSAFRNPQN